MATLIALIILSFPFVLFFLLILLVSGFFIVEQKTNAIVERFGKFNRISKPGLNWKIPIIDRVAGRLSLRVRQLDVQVETKTYDNVFIQMVVSVQFYVLQNRVYEAFYSLDNPENQIRSYIFDVVRARVPKIKLDDVFEKKDDIAVAVKDELAQVMDDFGYGITKTLVTDIDPDPQVKSAMNQINAAQRQKVAAIEKGEAEKIMMVKAAEAEAESKALQGKGVADQRKAIIDGLRESVGEFQRDISGINAQDAMNLVIITQYFDTLKDIGNSSKANTILIPHSPNSVNDISNQIREAMITANEVSKSAKDLGLEEEQ
jgi:regulator of protease activity HflC (stomatin/prohibitin superfamily)